jgi:hypothetical protein
MSHAPLSSIHRPHKPSTGAPRRFPVLDFRQPMPSDIVSAMARNVHILEDLRWRGNGYFQLVWGWSYGWVQALPLARPTRRLTFVQR